MGMSEDEVRPVVLQAAASPRRSERAPSFERPEGPKTVVVDAAAPASWRR